MDRELVWAVLSLLLGGLAALAMGWWPARHGSEASGRRLERLAWRRLWLPLAPAALVLAMLCGWAFQEPDEAEPAPPRIVLAALPYALLLTRTGVRGLRSLARAPGEPVAATVGLLRPRIVVSPRLVASLDRQALAAARAHEEAHARHFDPLRLWLGQLAADLQWPWPAARARFRSWTVAIELARDEEARANGTEGADLAAAVVAGARLVSSHEAPLTAGVCGDPGSLRDRVARLLAPLPPAPPASRAWAAVAAGLVAAAALGASIGESVCIALLGTVR